MPAYPKRDITISEAASRRIEQRIDLPSVLGRVPLLSVLDSEQVLRLAETGNLHEFPVETVIVSEGDVGASLFIVVAGVLEVSRGACDYQPEQSHIVELDHGTVPSTRRSSAHH